MQQHHQQFDGRRLGILGVLVAVCASCDAEAIAGAPGATPWAGPPLVVARGEVRRRLPLTGEVDAVAALELKVPRTPNGRVTVRLLAPEGTEVKAGDVVAALDGNSFAALVRERTLAVSQAEVDVERQRAENGVKEADAAMEVERRRAIMRRAEIDADVPVGILPKRDYLEKQLISRRTKMDFDKAEAALAMQKKASALDLSLKGIALGKAKRTLDDAETALKALTLRAPIAGTVLIGEHNQEKRKLQEGDAVLIGWTVARLAGSGARSVRAWLSDVDDGRIAVGARAEVVLDAHPKRTFSGKVREISPVARQPMERTQRRMFQVDVDLDEQDRALLRPGLSARVDVQAAVAQGLVVPRAALELGKDGAQLFLADGGVVPVSLGPCNAAACVLLSGADEGTRLRRAP